MACMTVGSTVSGVAVCQFDMREFGITDLHVDTSTHRYWW